MGRRIARRADSHSRMAGAAQGRQSLAPALFADRIRPRARLPRSEVAPMKPRRLHRPDALRRRKVVRAPRSSISCTKSSYGDLVPTKNLDTREHLP